MSFIKCPILSGRRQNFIQKQINGSDNTNATSQYDVPEIRYETNKRR